MQRGQAVPTRSLNQISRLLVGFWFSAPKVRPDPVFGPDANGRGREPLEEVLAHGTEKLAFACAFMTDAKVILRVSGLTHQQPEPKTASFMPVLVQHSKGMARPRDRPAHSYD